MGCSVFGASASFAVVLKILRRGWLKLRHEKGTVRATTWALEHEKKQKRGEAVMGGQWLAPTFARFILASLDVRVLSDPFYATCDGHFKPSSCELPLCD